MYKYRVQILYMCMYVYKYRVQILYMCMYGVHTHTDHIITYTQTCAYTNRHI